MEYSCRNFLSRAYLYITNSFNALIKLCLNFWYGIFRQVIFFRICLIKETYFIHISDFQHTFVVHAKMILFLNNIYSRAHNKQRFSFFRTKPRTFGERTYHPSCLHLRAVIWHAGRILLILHRGSTLITHLRSTLVLSDFLTCSTAKYIPRFMKSQLWNLPDYL